VRRRSLLGLIGATLLAPRVGSAQPKNLPTVGVLVTGGSLFRARLGLFRDELDALGFNDGDDIQIEVRSAGGDLARLPALAAQLVDRKVDVIVAYGTTSVLAARQATKDIPIVMIGAPDPVGAGLVASFERPGGNITGLAFLAQDLTEKGVALLKEALPDLSRLAALCNAPDPFAKLLLQYARIAGESRKIEIVPFTVAGDAEVDAAFLAMRDQKVQGVLVQPSLPWRRIAKLAVDQRLATAATAPGFANSGGLISYSAFPEDIERSAAGFVAKILKGTKPADLPVELPKRFELAVNLNTAKSIGVTLPSSLLVRADEVIEAPL
jgi:putative ABC transport system substrate-binding protein